MTRVSGQISTETVFFQASTLWMLTRNNVRAQTRLKQAYINVPEVRLRGERPRENRLYKTANLLHKWSMPALTSSYSALSIP